MQRERAHQRENRMGMGALFLSNITNCREVVRGPLPRGGGSKQPATAALHCTNVSLFAGKRRDPRARRNGGRRYCGRARAFALHPTPVQSGPRGRTQPQLSVFPA